MAVVLFWCVFLGCAARNAAAAEDPPIVFVHGIGDDASRWVPTIWLFESNGYRRDRLFALRAHNPVARTDNTRDEAARSSTDEAREELARFVQTVLQQTHTRKVVLVGSSRGGLTIRNYLQNGGGSKYVLADILCGTPNHGVNATDDNPNGEFNGKGTYLTALNRLSSDGTETVRGVRTLTLRSDGLDKYAQPTAAGFGHPERASGVSFDGPALLGADNEVLPGKDHRELAFSDEAFAAMYRFVTGHEPATTSIQSEKAPTVSGVITGYAGLAPTNDPLASVHVQVSSMTASGKQARIYETTTQGSGVWGPVQVRPDVEYVFDLEHDGRHVIYYLPPLARSTTLLNFRFAPSPADTDGKRGVLVSRPAGYFSRERDPVEIGGRAAVEEPAGLPVRDAFVAALPEGEGTVRFQLRGEQIYVKGSPDLGPQLCVVEFLR